MKVVLGHPVLGAHGIEWALSPGAARKLRDYLTTALDQAANDETEAK